MELHFAVWGEGGSGIKKSNEKFTNGDKEIYIIHILGG
jgi:hypothetical protein